MQLRVTVLITHPIASFVLLVKAKQFGGQNIRVFGARREGIASVTRTALQRAVATAAAVVVAHFFAIKELKIFVSVRGVARARTERISV